MRTSPQVAAKTERLLNLVICLLSTRRPLTRGQIRAAVAAYAQTPSEESFERMFERDKEELRELGVPLVTVQLDQFFDDEPAYRIDRGQYALPELHLAPDEWAVLSLASRAWSEASLGGAAAAALRKLAADGVEVDESVLSGVETQVRTVEPAFEAVTAAVVDCCPIRFAYRTRGAGEPQVRRIQPWSLTSRFGHWYVAGFDVDRQAPRVFRLSRVVGAVRRDGKPGSYVIPADHDAPSMIRRHDQDARVVATAWVRPGAGHAWRRRAVSGASCEAAPDGWDVLRVSGPSVNQLADEAASYGPVVRVVDPPELVEATVRRLSAVVAAHRSASPAGPQPSPEAQP
ncbi:YafY family protein [Austwickia sp. TVS 96-490-7B]|uniref:helix-turn-helix transcriptional regulator n=1 Tax=Austwickia sp. TVS 96-490-7B TaxID=2830843 RepID=UPI001C57F440|nr:WYL domain-containing protein [Austwickia sp. TVS 96-490-7B]